MQLGDKRNVHPTLVASHQRSVMKRICWTHRGTKRHNPACGTQPESQTCSSEPRAAHSVKSWLKACLECPLCNINHKSNINYVKRKRLGVFWHVRIWRALTQVSSHGVAGCRGHTLRTQTLPGLCFLGPQTYCSLGVCLCLLVHSWLHRSLVHLKLYETEMETGFSLGS